MSALGLVDHEDAVQATHAWDGSQGIEHELLIGFHVLGVNLDEKVKVSTRIVALRDLINMLDSIHKLLDE